MMKATIKYEVRLELMNEDRSVRRIHMCNFTNLSRNRWDDSCRKILHGCKLQTRAGSVRNCEWKVVLENGDGMNWSIRQWMNEVSGERENG